MAKFTRRGRRFGRRIRFKRRYGRRTYRGRRRLGTFKRNLNRIAEKKFIDANFSGNVTVNSQIMYVGTNIGEGAQRNQRIGRLIQARSLKIRLKAWTNGSWTTSDGPLEWRVIVGLWKDYQTSGTSVTQLMVDNTKPWLTMYERSPLQSKKWIPMYDGTFRTYAEDAYQSPVHLKKLNFAGKRLPMKSKQFDAISVVNNAYFILIWNNYVGVGPYPQYDITTRFTFTDV